MYFDLTTPADRLETMRAYQKHLLSALRVAKGVHSRLDKNNRALVLKTIEAINNIRHQVYEKAKVLGFVNQCTDALVVCRGECCSWHFPKNLGYLESFVIVCSTSSVQQSALEDQIYSHNWQYQCPVRREDGCLLSFNSRPLTCAMAYPCFAGDAYHQFLEEKKKEVDVYYRILKKLFQ